MLSHLFIDEKLNFLFILYCKNLEEIMINLYEFEIAIAKSY